MLLLVIGAAVGVLAILIVEISTQIARRRSRDYNQEAGRLADDRQERRAALREHKSRNGMWG